ncbi:hypothetical protein BS78_06G000400 [Paspalum vaginatum]|nr:hypothetical protein BS78_06G000400 [Paspalum vaginatum]
MKTHITCFLAKPGNCAPSGLKIPRTSGVAVCPSGIVGRAVPWENTVWAWKLCGFIMFPMVRQSPKTAPPTRWIRPTTVLQLLVWPSGRHGVAMFPMVSQRFAVVHRLCAPALCGPLDAVLTSIHFTQCVKGCFGRLDHCGYAGA